MLDELVDPDVFVQGTGEGEIITLRGHSKIGWQGEDPIVLRPLALNNNAPEALKPATAEIEGSIEANVSEKVYGIRVKRSFQVDRANISTEYPVTAYGGQERILRVSKEEDYYLIPVGVILKFLEQNVAKSSDSSSLGLILARAGKITKSWVEVADLTWQLSEEELKGQLKMLNHSFNPYLGTPKGFVLLQSPIKPPFGFAAFGEETELDLNGRINFAMKHPFYLNGNLYEGGTLTGIGKAHTTGRLERLLLTPPLTLNSDFARVTGHLNFERSDGIDKNWPTSVQLSPATLLLNATYEEKDDTGYGDKPFPGGSRILLLGEALGKGVFLGGIAATAALALNVISLLFPYQISDNTGNAIIATAGTAVFLGTTYKLLAEFSQYLTVPAFRHVDLTKVVAATATSNYSGQLYKGIIRSASASRSA